ncbi:MAG: hypothetical protein IT290_01395 [Deltaproteobacteria bacterium]|nr:hypothetical protein [Deltaproteobacteria bacterium]
MEHNPPSSLGIQGGPGSFNDDAALEQLALLASPSTRLVYLYTSEAVCEAVADAQIEVGQLALENSTGGVVAESVAALKNFELREVRRFERRVSHTLMIRNDSSIEMIDTIMTHPQVLLQCRQSLAAHYPQLRLTSGEGASRNTARVAEQLRAGELGRNIAVLGNRRLAEIHGLAIVAERLEDSATNMTTFGWFVNSPRN